MKIFLTSNMSQRIQFLSQSKKQLQKLNRFYKTIKINHKPSDPRMFKYVATKQKIIQINVTLEDLFYKKKEQQRKDTDILFYTLMESHYDEKDLSEMIREKMAAQAKVSKTQRKKWQEEEKVLTEKHKHALEYLSTTQAIKQDIIDVQMPEIDAIWKKLNIKIPPFDKNEFEMKFQLFLSSKTRHITDMDAELVIGLFLKWEEDCASFMTTVQKAIISSDVPLNLRKFIMSYVELFYIQDLYLQVPSFMDTMLRFEEKYPANYQQRYHYRVILKKRSIIFKIKLFIQKQLQQGRILNDGESLLTEFKGLVLGKQYHFIGEKRIDQDDGVITITNWADTRYALEIMGEKLKTQIEAFKLKNIFRTHIKIQQKPQLLQAQQPLEQKAQNKPKKKKKKPASKLQDKKQEQQNKIFDELSDFLQKLQINHQERIQCRLDEEWADKFARKFNLHTKPKSKKENFKFKNFESNLQKMQ